MPAEPSMPIGVPPNDPAAERGLLAALLTDPDLIPAVTRLLPAGPDAFYLERHKALYRAILDLHDRSEPVDANQVMDLLQQRGQDRLVDLVYLAGVVTEDILAAAHAPGYARRVQRDHARRMVLGAAMKAVGLAKEGVEDTRQFLTHIEGLFADLTNTLGDAERALTPAEMTEAAQRIIEERSTREPGVSTGMPALDGLMGGGLRYGELVSIGGKPSYGKSALMYAMTRGYARTNRRPAAFIAGEQQADELVVRHLAARADTPSNALNPHNLRNPLTRKRFEQAAAALKDDLVHIRDPRPFTLTAILRASRECVQRYGCGLVAWDYGQIIDAGTGDTRRDVLAVTRAAKQFAQQHQVIVLLAGQILQTAQGRPQREHFKESKSFSEDSDICLLLHRPDMDFTEEDEQTLGVADKGWVAAGTTLVICDKNRRGVWGSHVLTTLTFDGPKFRYAEENPLGVSHAL